jgi:hypothetical protein
MKKKWLIGGVIVVLASIGLTIAYQRDQQQYKQMVLQASDVPKWTADQGQLVTKETVMSQVVLRNDMLKNVDVESFIIPGLRGAWSINHKTKKAGFGNDWVPQGLTQSSDKYFVSAYDGDFKLNSVIFVVDKKTRQYEKTLILSSKSHLGGIAYDNSFNRLWYSDDQDGGGLSYIEDEFITPYDAKQDQKPITHQHIALPWAERTSGIAIYKDMIVVVKYGLKEEDRSVVTIPLDSKFGLPTRFTDRVAKAFDKVTNESEFINTLLKENIIAGIAPGWDRMQGVAVDESGLTILSQSAGFFSSTLLIREPNDKSGKKFNFSKPQAGEASFKVPPSVEQVSLNNPTSNELAMIFESGARKYRERGFFLWRPAIMDRVIILPVTINYKGDQ